ncbi:hypothetical protein AB6A23_10000 [Paenibacillus tarimensis]
MDEQHRKLIVKEIQHWQRSKLLPEQYCDFLLNLYLDDPTKRPPTGIAGKAAAAIQRSKGRHWFLVFGLASLICFIALYFSLFHPLMQIAVMAAGVLVLLLLGHRLRPRNEAFGLVFVSSGMLTMLGLGLYYLKLHGISHWAWQMLFLAVCAILWIIYGIGARIPLLHLCGWIAAIMVYAMLLSRNTDRPEWYEIQLYWVPAALLFAWGSWFVGRWSKEASAVVMITAALLWFMPEIYNALLIVEPVGLQMQIILKIAVGGILLYALRKRWIAWVV